MTDVDEPEILFGGSRTAETLFIHGEVYVFGHFDSKEYRYRLVSFGKESGEEP